MVKHRVATPPGNRICNNILETIGYTPMVRINSITRGQTDATVVAKIETFNPGNSIKDRMALKMIEDAERTGKLKPGGTIIEGTSGNTGMDHRPSRQHHGAEHPQYRHLGRVGA